MSLLNKIKSVLGRRRPAQPPADDRSEETSVSEGPAAPVGEAHDASSGLRNSLARGAAEGTARETLRKIFEELFDD
ncbi:hypothetical protein [Streptomyces sp. NPDC020298]|uniref:hypothetical protein n=1 Tax=unclassified Streptomyces TaxID=2593676 RepID=UPI0033C5C752